MTASSSDSRLSRVAAYVLIAVVFVSAIAVVVLGTLVVSDRLSGSESASTDATSGVNIRIYSRNDGVAVDRYFELGVVINNDSTKPFSVDEGVRCTPKFDVWIDGELRASPAVDCEQDRQDLLPGESDLVLETFDLSELSVGSHSFVVESSGVKSNTLTVDVGPAEAAVFDCYAVTDRLMPGCGHVRLDIATYEDSDLQRSTGDFCRAVVSQLIQPSELQPIASLSTTDCNAVEWSYFVFNVAPGDEDVWLQQLDVDIEGWDGAGFVFAGTIEYPKL